MEKLPESKRRFGKQVAGHKKAALLIFTCFALILTLGFLDQKSGFNGLGMNMGNLSRLSHAKSRSISPENFTGEKGKGGMAIVGQGTASKAAKDLGQGWKVNPYIRIKPGETFVMADIKGPGAVQHIWLTPTGNLRLVILRMYWDDEKTPSIECPIGDFFACAYGQSEQVSSLAVCVNPMSGFNCYWEMPFRKRAKITVTNMDTKVNSLYYQIDYTLTNVPKETGYFHAQFRRTNPVPFKEVYTILDGVKGWGHFVGTYMSWKASKDGWWGEGEIKFYIDGDKEFPTICGTGTEDYFCGSYCFKKSPGDATYTAYNTPYVGMPQVMMPPKKAPKQPRPAGARFGLYRWHIMDPVRFEKDLKVTMQALGWQKDGKYLPLEEDISSVAYWYQTEPHAAFPNLPEKDALTAK